MNKQLIFIAALVLTLSGCKKMDEPSSHTSPYDIVLPNMLISNNRDLLNERLSFTSNSPEYVFGDTTKKTMKSSKGETGSSVTIQLIARLFPPEYNGEILQASHVRIVGDYAFVAYNTRGSRYLGAVDVVDISNPADPEVMSSVLFINQENNKGRDVSSVDVKISASPNSKSYLWIAGADETSDSAFVERYELNSHNQFQEGKSVNVGLKGNVGTDVRYFNDKVYVTSGNGGGLTILDNQMKVLSYMDLDKARSVDVNKDFEIALGGNPGHLYNPGVWDKEIGGANDPEAKSIVRLYNKFALAALGDEGLKCYDISSGAPSAAISSIPRPVVPDGGLPLNYVTNGVSVTDKGWVYIANGMGGLDVAKVDANGQLKWMGNVDLESSVNFVDANANYVFAARGDLGMKVLKVTEN